jgi:hypothetical protein
MRRYMTRRSREVPRERGRGNTHRFMHWVRFEKVRAREDKGGMPGGEVQEIN